MTTVLLWSLYTHNGNLTWKTMSRLFLKKHVTSALKRDVPHATMEWELLWKRCKNFCTNLAFIYCVNKMCSKHLQCCKKNSFNASTLCTWSSCNHIFSPWQTTNNINRLLHSKLNATAAYIIMARCLVDKKNLPSV